MKSGSGSVAVPQRPRRAPWWQRRVPVVVSLSVLVLLGAAGLVWVQHVLAEREVEDALAELDRADPGWRLKDVEKARAQIPDGENSALHIQALVKRLPRNWASPPNVEEFFEELPPAARLNEQQVQVLRAALEKAANELPDARKLKDLPRGRFPLTYAPDFISTIVPTQDARVIAQLLAHDARLRAEEKNPDGALESCRGVLNCARAVGDEPLLVSMLIRVAIQGVALEELERTLAQGEPDPAGLLALQQLLEDEAGQPLLLNALRGERAGFDHLMDNVQKGEVPVKELLGEPGWQQKLQVHHGANVPRDRVELLHMTTQAVAIARLPLSKQPQAFKDLTVNVKEKGAFVLLLVPAYEKVASAFQRSQARLRCASAALAAERFRRDRGAWPENLAALVEAKYLKAVPTDPYDDAPLRWKRLADGMVIYTLGPDGLDHGGHFDRNNPIATNTDIGFRLWDPDRRRQPPLPPKKDPDHRLPGDPDPDGILQK